MSETLTPPQTGAPQQEALRDLTALHYEQLNGVLETHLPVDSGDALASSLMAKAAAEALQHPTEGVSIAPDGSTVDAAIADKIQKRSEAGINAYALSDETRARWEAYAKGGPTAEADEAQRNADVDEYTRHKYPLDMAGRKADKPAYTAMESYARAKLKLDIDVKRSLKRHEKLEDLEARAKEVTAEPAFTVKDKRHGNRSDTKAVPAHKSETAKSSTPEKAATKAAASAEAEARKAAKAAERAKRLKEVEAREKLHKGMDRERWERSMKGKTHVDAEALKQQWAEEDAAEERTENQKAANERIDQIIKAKKFRYGSRAVERGGMEDDLYQEAIAQAAREGHNVEHLFEDNDNETYHGKHRGDELDAHRPAAITEAQWSELDDAEKRETIIFEANQLDAKRPHSIDYKKWKDLSAEDKRDLIAYEASRNNQVGGEPAVATGVTLDLSPRGRTARIHDFMSKKLERIKLSSDPEKDRKRKWIAGGVAGALVLGTIATVAYLEAKGHVPGGTTGSLPGPHNRGGSGPTGGHSHAGAQVKEVTIGRGGNPWAISIQQLKAHGVKHPTQAQILSYDKKLGRANGYGWAEWMQRARHLMPGVKLKLPK